MRAFRYPALLLLSLATALFCLAYPVYVIQPFRPQGPRELQLALLVVRIRPVVTLLACAAAVLLLALSWRGRRLAARIGLAAAVLGVFACAALTRINVYEIMFHPMGSPTFEAAAASGLDGKEMVIAVNVDHVARAYPIRVLSYHHIANDTVGGVPIVATY